MLFIHIVCGAGSASNICILSIQVQIQTSKCPNYHTNTNKPWCNCGVVVAAGRDVFIVNNCNKNLGWEIAFRICEDGVLKDKVVRRGNNYYVSHMYL